LTAKLTPADTAATACGSFEQDDAFNVAYYSRLLEEYGSDVRTVDWSSRQSQHLRFAVLSGVGFEDGCSILDVGCGLGDLLEWIEARSIAVQYTGIDITPAMIELCKARFPNHRFISGNLSSSADDLGDRFDWVVASGLFSFRQHQPFAYLQQVVSSMFALASRGVAFNALSSWASRRSAGEFHADPVETAAWCRTQTPWVTLRHDYHPGDFTIYMQRRPVGR